MQEQRLFTGEFVISESGKRSGRAAPNRRWERLRREQENARSLATGMWLKISICAVALLIVIAVEVLTLTEQGDEPVRAVSGEAETESEDAYGKLQFVSAGSAKSVFSISRKWRAPVDAVEVTGNVGGGVTLAAGAGERVLLPAAGEVRAVATNEASGASVRVYHGDGLTSVYSGLGEVCVEEGQPLLALDTLGTVGESGTLQVHVWLDGAEVDALAYIDAVKTP